MGDIEKKTELSNMGPVYPTTKKKKRKKWKGNNIPVRL
jgi:hypothetical protein